MKKILFISHSPRLDGGAEITLLQSILFFKKNNFKIFVILPSEGMFAQELKKNKIKYFIVDFKWSVKNGNTSFKKNKHDLGINAASIINSYKIIALIKPNYVITNTITVPWAGYAAKAMGYPHILMISEIYDTSNLNPLPNEERFIKLLNYSCDAIIYNSLYTKKFYNGLMQKKFNSIMYPALNQDILMYEHKNDSKDNRTTQIITVGGIIEHKNQIESLMALKKLIDNGFDTKLTIVGSIGSRKYYKKLKAFIIENNISKYVQFKPFTKDIYRLIAQSDIVTVTTHSESFGRVAAEAQCIGTYVISSDKGASKEIINSKLGTLYKLGDPDDLYQKIKNYINKKVIINNTISKNKKYAIEKYAKKEPNVKLMKLLSKLDNLKDTDAPLEYDPIRALINQTITLENKLNDYHNSLIDAGKTINELKNKKSKITKKIRILLTK